MRALLVLLLATTLAPSVLAQEGTMLHMLEMKFTPDHLVVAPAETVVVMNFDNVTHTVTSLNLSFAETVAPAFDHTSFQPHPFQAPTAAGNYTFYCRYHETMLGSLLVDPTREPATPPATPTPTTPTPTERNDSPLPIAIVAVAALAAVVLRSRALR